jgi:uncharacterized damage-inducible protein DinB
MKTSEWFIAQLDAEAPKTRRALERVPEGHGDWKPHDKSMPFGRLASLVARMPSWISLVIKQDELDLNPPGGGSNTGFSVLETNADLLKAFDESVAGAHDALKHVDDARLHLPWTLKMSGKAVSSDPRHIVLRDTFMHLSHHRGQLTVYLRLSGAQVPSIYGPTADDHRFA